jgi:hypothetical protein
MFARVIHQFQMTTTDDRRKMNRRRGSTTTKKFNDIPMLKMCFFIDRRDTQQWTSSKIAFVSPLDR